MRNEEPIGTTKRLLKRIRPIEIDRSYRDTVRRLGSIGPPGQRHDVDRVGGEQAS